MNASDDEEALLTLLREADKAEEEHIGKSDCQKKLKKLMQNPMKVAEECSGTETSEQEEI